MSTPGIPLFSPEALSVLDRQAHDPAARADYEVMAGGLIWPDEFPTFGTPACAVVSRNCVHRFLIAYRASITMREERAELRPVWDQVVRHAPHWPGLRVERRGERARRRLLAAKRREARCLAELAAVIAGAEATEPGSHLKVDRAP
jgi:hypothetical protein